MRLIIGGQAQGKLDYAMRQYGIDREEVVSGDRCSAEELREAVCIDRLQDYILRQVKERVSGSKETEGSEGTGWNPSAEEPGDPEMPGLNPAGEPEDFLYLLPPLREDAVVICNEVGLGIVPVDPVERMYREVTGRICCRLAARAVSVERVQCGIPMRIK